MARTAARTAGDPARPGSDAGSRDFAGCARSDRRRPVRRRPPARRDTDRRNSGGPDHHRERRGSRHVLQPRSLLTSLVLRRHFDDQKRPLELVRAVPDPASKPVAVVYPGNPELTRLATGALYAVEKSSSRAVRFRYGDDRLSVTKEIRFEDGYLFDVKVAASGSEFTVPVGAGLRNPTAKEKASSYLLPPTAVLTSGGDLQHVPPKKLKKEETWPVPANGFVGIEDNYFLAVLAPRQPATARVFPVCLPQLRTRPRRRPSRWSRQACRPGNAGRPRLLRSQGRGDPGERGPRSREDRGLRLVRNPRPPPPVASQEGDPRGPATSAWRSCS